MPMTGGVSVQQNSSCLSDRSLHVPTGAQHSSRGSHLYCFQYDISLSRITEVKGQNVAQAATSV